MLLLGGASSGFLNINYRTAYEISYMREISDRERERERDTERERKREIIIRFPTNTILRL
jgi:hypothetical protein